MSTPGRMGRTTQRALDDGLGLTSTFSVACDVCRGDVEFDTDPLGRSIERCRSCGHVRSMASTAPRPEGDRYNATHQGRSPARREPRRFPDATDDVDVQQLRAARSARTDAPMSPELADAKRAFDALEADIKAARKGGRPRGPTLNIGRQGRPKRGGPVVILNDDGTMPDPPGGEAAVGPAVHGPPATPVLARQRPLGFRDLKVPAAPPPPTTESAMSSGTPKSSKTCPQCEKEFAPTNNRQEFCSVDCRSAAKRTATSPKAQKAAPRRQRVSRTKKPRRAVSGYRAPKSRGGLSSAIGHLKIELDAIDARRDQLVSMISQLEAFETETAPA